MKISVKGYITHKGTEEYSDCADNYAFNEEYLRFAISDGVSKSFFPKIWSTVLVNNYVSKDHWKDDEFVSKCQVDWQLKIDEIIKQPSLMYYTKNAYHNKVPALATFVGLQIFPEKKKWSCQAIGDSFLFFVPHKFTSFEDEVEIVSSKKNPLEFDNFPDYLASIGNNHNGEPNKIKNKELVDGTFYLMTDALAEWFVKFKEKAPNKISVWKNQKDFERFVSEAREIKEMSDDDSAILIIELIDTNKRGLEFQNNKVNELSELINIQKLEIENKIEEKEKEIEIHTSKELETLQNETVISEILESESKEESPKEGFLAKAKGFFFSGKDKEENKEAEIPEEKTSIELENIEQLTIKQLELTTEEPINPETTVAENENSRNDKNEELVKEKIEQEAKNEKIESEIIEPKEQPKVDPKAKSIIDRFEK